MSEIAFQAKPLSRRVIRQFATQVRCALGYRDRPYIDVEEVLEFVLPTVVPGFLFEVRRADEMGTSHGLAEPDNRLMILREDVHERACNGEGRDRLTVMHELGHLLLHHKDRIVLRKGTGNPKRYCDPEWQANCFAGELLVAHTLATQFRSPLELSLGFGVSLKAAKFQWNCFEGAGILPKTRRAN